MNSEPVPCPCCQRQYAHLADCPLPPLQAKITQLLRIGCTPEQLNQKLDAARSEWFANATKPNC